VDTEDDVSFQYQTPSTITVIVSPAGAEEEEWFQPGVIQRGDFLMTCLPDTDVNAGDIIEYDSKWYRVEQIVERVLGPVKYSKELVVRRVET